MAHISLAWKCLCLPCMLSFSKEGLRIYRAVSYISINSDEDNNHICSTLFPNPSLHSLKNELSRCFSHQFMYKSSRGYYLIYNILFHPFLASQPASQPATASANELFNDMASLPFLHVASFHPSIAWGIFDGQCKNSTCHKKKSI